MGARDPARYTERSMPTIQGVLAILTATAPAANAAPSAHKPQVVEISASWCGPCKVFDQEVLPAPAVVSALRDVTFVQVDADSPSGQTAATRYHIEHYPTFLIVDRAGAETTRREGLLDRDAFLALLSLAKQGK
jgi:thiol:disulfide interchange protein